MNGEEREVEGKRVVVVVTTLESDGVQRSSDEGDGEG